VPAKMPLKPGRRERVRQWGDTDGGLVTRMPSTGSDRAEPSAAPKGKDPANRGAHPPPG